MGATFHGQSHRTHPGRPIGARPHRSRRARGGGTLPRVIVVVGSPWARLEEDRVVATGLAVGVARAAAATGAVVQLVGRIGEGPIGDGVLVDLGRAGIAHVASLRSAAEPTPLEALPGPAASAGGDDADPGDLLIADDSPAEELLTVEPQGRTDRPIGMPGLDAADLELALRYLGEFRVVILAEAVEAAAAQAVAEAAGYAGATLISIVADADARAALPDALDGAIVIETPGGDPDGAFARLVAGLAAALDRGDAPDAAFRSAVTAAGWARSEA